PEFAQVFRGDSFQLLFKNPQDGLRRTLQLRCWFKKNTITDYILDARMAIGVGEISYYGDTVLDSDGEAFHISGRAFDAMEDGEFIKVVTADQAMNEQLNVICRLMDVIISGWTPSQAEVIFLALENKTQQQMADQLNVGQSAINNRLKLAKWKEIERTIRYISALLKHPE
ncbi:MAG TPA: SatD family protein, partial [Daejeonella sp.]|nr:SatD family protein [Daejeonella sp.]